MAYNLHTLSSDDSNDSLPDLHSRVMGKLSKEKEPLPVHTVSSDDDDDMGSGIVTSLTKENMPLSKIKDEDESDDIQDITPLKLCVKEPSFRSHFRKESVQQDPFDDDLPDIQNFTILTSGLDNEDDDKDNQCVALAPQKLKSQEVKEEKDAKRREREALRAKRALEKAESRAQKEAEKKSRRALKPGECMKYVKVQLDRHLLELPEGSQVITRLVEADIRYEVVDSPVSYAATVIRIDPLTLQETLAEDAVILLPVQVFNELVEGQIYRNGVGGLCQQCKQWKQDLGNPRITLVIAGLQAYVRGKALNKRQEFRMAVLGENAEPKRKKKKGSQDEPASNVTRIDIETALVMAQLECGVNHRLFQDAEKVAGFITQITKSLAEAPLKWEKDDTSFSWYAEGSSVNSVKVDKVGVGLLTLWHQQLQQFNNVGPEVSQAIAREYPSPQALVQAYRHSSSEKEASLLLAQIPVRRGTGPLVSTRRIGPELSRKIHLFFTSIDPDVNLGQKS